MEILFKIAVICSIFSQMPFLLQTTTAEILKLSWLLPFVACFFQNPKGLFKKATWPFYTFVAVFITYCMACEGMTAYKYIGSDVYNVIFSFGVFIVSFSVWQRVGSQRFLNEIAFICGISTAFVGAVIYIDYISKTSVTELMYAYGSKNSAAQIILNSSILLLCTKVRNRYYVLLTFIAVVAFMVEIMLLKSRATMIGLFFVILYLATVSKNKGIKVLVRILILCGIVYLCYNTELLDTIYNNLLLANRNASDLNELSSGRLLFMKKAWDLFRSSMLIGVGNLYLDCFPLAILTQYGVIGASIILAFVLYVFVIVKKLVKENTNLYTCAFLLYVTILLNSLFEAQPPFGPGMKCFIVWMVIGFAFAENYCHPKRIFHKNIVE